MVGCNINMSERHKLKLVARAAVMCSNAKDFIRVRGEEKLEEKNYAGNCYGSLSFMCVFC